MRLLGHFQIFVAAKQHEVSTMFADTPSARLCDAAVLRMYTSLAGRVRPPDSVQISIHVAELVAG